MPCDARARDRMREWSMRAKMHLEMTVRDKMPDQD